MNCDTGHLLNLNSEVAQKLFGEPENLEIMAKKMHELNYRPVPQELQNQAQKELGNIVETCVNLTEDTALTRWAEEQRNIVKPYTPADLLKELQKLTSQNQSNNWVHEIAKELGILDNLGPNDCYDLDWILSEIRKLKILASCAK